MTTPYEVFSGLSTIFQWIIGFLAVTSAIGLAFLLIKGSYNKASMDALRADNNDLRQRDKDNKDKIIELEHQVELLQTKTASLENENRILRTVEVPVDLDRHVVELTGAVAALKVVIDGYYHDIVALQPKEGGNDNG